MVLSGIITFGKKTFENKLALPTIELLTSLNTLENNCQSKIAEATKTKLVAASALPLILVEI